VAYTYGVWNPVPDQKGYRNDAMQQMSINMAIWIQP